MREISKLLASNGTVAGKGESIDKKKSKKRVEKVDVVTQVDSFTIEFETNKASLKVDMVRRKSDFAPIPDLLAAQLIDRLETHKRTLEKQNSFEMSFENNFYPEPSTDLSRD